MRLLQLPGPEGPGDLSVSRHQWVPLSSAHILKQLETPLQIHLNQPRSLFVALPKGQRWNAPTGRTLDYWNENKLMFHHLQQYWKLISKHDDHSNNLKKIRILILQSNSNNNKTTKQPLSSELLCYCSCCFLTVNIVSICRLFTWPIKFLNVDSINSSALKRTRLLERCGPEWDRQFHRFL